MNPKPESPLTPLRDRAFLTYWLAGLSSNIGWQVQVVGASWLMTTIGGSPQMIALVQTSLALPVMLFSLPAGAIADAIGRRSVVLWSQAFLLLVSIVLAACAFLGVISPWLLLLFTFLVGTGKALNNPGWQTMASELVARERLASAVALTSIGVNVARSVGPAFGGVLVAVLGAFAAFLTNALSNFGILAVAYRWKSEAPDKTLPPEPFGSAILAGLRYVLMSPNILRLVIRAGFFNITAISIMALMPVVARDLVGGGPETYGLLLGAFGVGGVSGAFGLSGLRRRLTQEWQVRIGFVVFALATALLGLSTNLALSMGAAAIAGASWLLTLSTLNAAVQISSPRWVVSRSLAIFQTVSFAGNALGSWMWGTIATEAGISSTLVVAAVAIAAGAPLGLFLALMELDGDGLVARGDWHPPEVALDLVPQSGPILTSVQYRIAEKDTPEFLRIMVERRKSRIRDGAHRWTLSRDMLDPEIWMERYMTPTWVETVRHHRRRTKSSAELTERIRELHLGPDKPSIRYEIVRHPGRELRDAEVPLGDGHH